MKIKKHKYDPEIAEEINDNENYWLRFFENEAKIRNDKFFNPKRTRNGDLKMKCVFGKEQTPSFRINSKRNTFKCFHCGRSGTFLGFLMQLYNQSFIESVIMALKMEIPKKEKIYPEVREQLEIIFPEPDNNRGDSRGNDLPF